MKPPLPSNRTVPPSRRAGRFRSPSLAFWTVWGVAVTGCSSSGEVGGPSTTVMTSDVEGAYTVQLTYGENGCNLEQWVEGSMLSGVVLEIIQDEEQITGTVAGVTGGVLGLVHGSNIYEGSLMGSDFDMTIFGKFPQVSGNCTYTLNNRATGTFQDDFIEGTLQFVTQTNGNPDCETVACSSVIAFNGSRPPDR